MHDSPLAPLVRQRWVFTDQPFLPVDSQCVFLNRIWDSDDVADVRVGALPTEEAHFVQDDRWNLPPIPLGGHMCRPDLLAVGEPWPIPPTLPPTVYLVGWIPECCTVPFDFEGGARTPINGEPASQLRQYAIEAVEAAPTTPFTQSTVGNAVGGTGPNVPGATFAYYPGGTAAPPGVTQTTLSNMAGEMVSVVNTVTFPADVVLTVEQATLRHKWTIFNGVDPSELTYQYTGGQYVLGGVNVRIAPAIMPVEATVYQYVFLKAVGVDQSDAEPVTVQAIGADTDSDDLSGFILPEHTTGPYYVSVHRGATPATIYLYPETGGLIATAGGVDAPLALAPDTVTIVQRVAPGVWVVVHSGPST